MLALCAGIGGKVHSQKQQQIQESIAESIQAEAEAERIRQQELANRLPELSDSQVQLLDQIEDALQQGDLSAAAELMIQQGERLWVLCYDVLDGEPYPKRRSFLSGKRKDLFIFHICNAVKYSSIFYK